MGRRTRLLRDRLFYLLIVVAIFFTFQEDIKNATQGPSKHSAPRPGRGLDTNREEVVEHKQTSLGEDKQDKEETIEDPREAELAKRRQRWKPHSQPVSLELKLPQEILDQEWFQSESRVIDRFGFNLKLSNEIPLDRHFPDYRMEQCKERVYPDPSEMPKVSVIIIYYNEALSTLLRNVVSVLNRSPPELLGEIVLVDDFSTLDQLHYLPEHLDRLNAQLPEAKIRSVRREVHDGIVGARVRGAEEAAFPIIVFLDSHAEACDGWLEPLVYRIHEDRTRAVVPNIRGINIRTLDLLKGDSWPPARGFFNWRLSFTIETADVVHDLAEPGVPLRTAAMKSPVMPGGLFAMDRKFFFDMGAYDPEIKYYGAEHVELSFRVWMCGGSMESIPCSNVGHIYREFNRFGRQQDPLLKNVNIGSVLNRNDARVAEVWLDDYKQIYYNFRGHVNDIGDISDRKELRSRLQCKSFEWFLKEVCRDQYVPDKLSTAVLLKMTSSVSNDLCMDSRGNTQGPVGLSQCRGGSSQKFSFTQEGFIQVANYIGHQLICVRIEPVSQVSCDEAPSWDFEEGVTEIKIRDQCLTRGPDSGDQVKIRSCDGRSSQQWRFTDHGTIAAPEGTLCVDNMQRKNGPPGMYGCHGYGTQQWIRTPDNKIKSISTNVCIGIQHTVGLFRCLKDDPDFLWELKGGKFSSKPYRDLCLKRGSDESTLAVGKCSATVNMWTLN
eukprot:m.24449 g.24449  ORF g.24449 m.24449 type:complete len:719 (+) comp7608_c1_seq2:260-2416(+)